MRKIRVHDYHKLTCAFCKTLLICRPQTQLALSLDQDLKLGLKYDMELIADILSVFFIEIDDFFCHLSSFVWTIVLDDYDFKIKITKTYWKVILIDRSLIKQIGNQWKIIDFIINRK